MLAAQRAEAQTATPGPIVETTTGRLRGLALNGAITFKGVRYGASTAGANRFQPPATPSSWTGVVDAFEYIEALDGVAPLTNGIVVPLFAAAADAAAGTRPEAPTR